MTYNICLLKERDGDGDWKVLENDIEKDAEIEIDRKVEVEKS